MKNKHLLALIIFLFIISCKEKEKVDDKTVIFEGITVLNEYGEMISFDSDDWHLNDKFTEREKQLFDTLDFNKTAEIERVLNEGIIHMHSIIKLFPNPMNPIDRKSVV